MNRRRGVSLLELVVVMTGCTALLTLSAVVLHRTLHTHGKAKAFLDAQRSALRLSEQFRRDVNQAKTASTDQLPEGVALQLAAKDGQRVEYRFASGVVQRTEASGEKTTSREEFVFPASSNLTIRREDTAGMLTLSLTNDASDPDGPAVKSFVVPLGVEIQSVLGRDAEYREAPEAAP